MTKMFSNLVEEMYVQVQEVQRFPNMMKSKMPIPRHIIIKMQKIKDKERILKAAREKRVTYKGISMTVS